MVGTRKIPDISDRKPPGRFLWSLPRRFDLYEIYGVFTRKSCQILLKSGIIMVTKHRVMPAERSKKWQNDGQTAKVPSAVEEMAAGRSRSWTGTSPTAAGTCDPLAGRPKRKQKKNGMSI
jgi:hypothetical protein